jgi:hypothetical protein
MQWILQRAPAACPLIRLSLFGYVRPPTYHLSYQPAREALLGVYPLCTSLRWLLIGIGDPTLEEHLKHTGHSTLPNQRCTDHHRDHVRQRTHRHKLKETTRRTQSTVLNLNCRATTHGLHTFQHHHQQNSLAVKHSGCCCFQRHQD